MKGTRNMKHRPRWEPITELEKEGYRNIEEVRQEVGRDKVFKGTESEPRPSVSGGLNPSRDRKRAVLRVTHGDGYNTNSRCLVQRLDVECSRHS